MVMIAPLTNAVFVGRMNDPTKLAAVGIANVILMLMI
jgi:Na+-driven multidrug efflux pump